MTDHRHDPALEPDAEAMMPPRASLFTGVQVAVADVLGVSSLRHRSALRDLGAQPQFPAGVVDAIYRTIARNYADRRTLGSARSNQTWRWHAPQLQIGAGNRSLEVGLERAVVRAAATLQRLDWSNQVPVASGLMGPNSDRRCAIDLVHQVGEGRFEFIELKMESDTPLYAAVEIIGYGCAWLLARREVAREPLVLLAARRIDLIVLAPAAFYAPFQLGPLQALLASEVAALGRREGVELKFAFQVLDEAAVAPANLDDARLMACLDHRRPL